MLSRSLHIGVAACLALCALGTSSIAADRMEKLPKELKQVTLSEKPGAQLPQDKTFVDEKGRTVRLGSLFGTKPIILTFNYSNCPMLCSLQLGGLVETMLNMDWTIGKEFDIVTISLDPKEGTVRSRETKSRYLERYQRPGASEGWHFLTGNEADIKAVTDAVGFGYVYHPERNEYLHPAVLTFVSPEGKVSGYMAGVAYDPIALRDKLIIAALGDISEALAEFILSCYHYEPTTGSAVIAQKIMRYGGLIFVFGFLGALAVFGMKRSRANANAYQVGTNEDHV